jgi:hypothetical protein
VKLVKNQDPAIRENSFSGDKVFVIERLDCQFPQRPGLQNHVVNCFWKRLESHQGRKHASNIMAKED